MKWTLGLTVAALGLTLTACGSGGSGHPAASQAGQVNSGQSGAAAALSVAQNPSQGSILVDSAGHTLYLFEKDHGTSSACTGACAQIWPGYSAGATPNAGSGVDAAKLSTASGQVPAQVTYNGHLLYTFSGDKAPGDVNGVGIPDWYPVSPSGSKVDHDDNAGKSNPAY
jgi:predicted lipoprotein with Yx(FWY)xxD motif